jgi:AcrR family transcriptional regulator
MKRAAGPLDKEERRQEILRGAEILFRERDYDQIRMNDLAASLGLAKGTLYLYFPQKESLFMALLGDRLDAALGGLMEAIKEPGEGAGEDGVERIAAAIAAGIAEDPALPRLLAELHVVLERNVPYEEALAFKRRLAAAIGAAGVGVAAALPPLREEDGVRFFLQVYAQVVGLAGLSDLSPFMRKISAEPGLGLFRMDFEDALAESARAMLDGRLRTARGRG